MTEVIISGDFGIEVRNGETCWRCGKSAPEVKMTIHHGIPQTMKPLKNVEIPICEECHDEINKQDVMSVLQFVYKISKNTEELGKYNEQILAQVRKATSIIENLGVIKIKTRGKENGNKV